MQDQELSRLLRFASRVAGELRSSGREEISFVDYIGAGSLPTATGWIICTLSWSQEEGQRESWRQTRDVVLLGNGSLAIITFTYDWEQGKTEKKSYAVAIATAAELLTLNNRYAVHKSRNRRGNNIQNEGPAYGTCIPKYAPYQGASQAISRLRRQ